MAEENWKIVKSITLLNIPFILQKQSKLIAEIVENRNEPKEDKPFESLLLRNNHQQFFVYPISLFSMLIDTFIYTAKQDHYV